MQKLVASKLLMKIYGLTVVHHLLYVFRCHVNGPVTFRGIHRLDVRFHSLTLVRYQTNVLT